MMNVGLYSDWPEPFDVLLGRMRQATPALNVDGGYKALRFVTPDEPHDAALVFNATDQTIFCRKENTYVLIFEPVEILGDTNPWLHFTHPQAGANIYSFCDGTPYPTAYGLHLVQATIAPVDIEKRWLCSMICSYKTDTPYHRKRREVLEALLATDLNVDFWGRGMRPDENDPRIQGEITTYTKDIALRPYEFVVDFENSHRNVLTDKFLDPILNLCVPITNSTIASKLFPPGSFHYVDFSRPVDYIVDEISYCLTEPVDRAAVLQARTLITEGELNLCEWLYRKVAP